MPPPSTTSATSVTAAIGTMCSAMRRASSSTTSRASASPPRAAAKIARASYGGESGVGAPSASRCASADSAAAHGIDLLLEADGDVVELAGRAVVAALQLAAQHEARRRGRCRPRGT